MHLLAHAPRLDGPAAERIARERYALDARATSLPSERDQNFLLTTPTGARFVLKVANTLEDRDQLVAQTAAMARVAERTGLAPGVRLATDGQAISDIVLPDGKSLMVRIVGFISGVPAGDVKHRTAAYRRDLGRCIGAMDRALEGFDHPGAHREFHWDLARGVETCRRLLPVVSDGVMRERVELALGRFEQEVVPVLALLPRSVIHNDANDFNVIVRDEGDPETRRQRVAGIVDYGDMVHSHTVGDLAIAAAYAVLDARDPLAAAADVVAGYHAERALSDKELAALHGLIVLRLLTSVCVGADQRRQRPDDPYLAISQAPIERTLPVLLRIPSHFAEATHRHACGLSPVPAADRVRAFLATAETDFAPVIGMRLGAGALTHISLDPVSPLVSGVAEENAEPALTRRVLAAIERANAQVGFGGYAEARMVYSSPAFADEAAAPGERRTIHLGVDLFAPAGTAVNAPMAGTVAAFANNTAPQDYGPVMILEHSTPDGTRFHSLYGHLALESLATLRVGRRVEAGQRIGSLGTAEVNGGWTPHLHFQLITDLLGLGTVYPGVCRPSEREAWLALSPDPRAMLGIPVDAVPAPLPTARATLAARRTWLGSNLSVGYREPVKIVRGAGQYLFDDQGRRFLDAYNNVPHVGHANPRVVRAASDQMAILNTNTRYLHDAVNTLAERICATLPAPLRVCWFVNSGSEANELALRIARAHTRQTDLIVLEAAYHGNTTTLIDISPYKHAGPGGQGAPDWVHTVPIPDVYRGEFRAADPHAGERYAAAVGETIARMTARGRGLCGYIAESLPSVGGQIVLPQGYLAGVYAHVRAAGGVCIADEVQTGYGRIGIDFWGFEPQRVVPDIVVLGKPIGNGYPLGAVITTPEIAASFDDGMEYFSTFGGSTVSSVVGLAVLREVQDAGLQAHARAVGERLLAGLRPFIERHALVGDVRGSGLFLGVELVRDRATLEPAAAEASYVANRMREEGILLGTDGPFHNVVKIRPPMPFAMDDADRLVETFDRILSDEVVVG